MRVLRSRACAWTSSQRFARAAHQVHEGRANVTPGPGLGFDGGGRCYDDVAIGDAFTTTWTVTALHPKPRHGGGVVVLAGVARNQDGIVVAEADGKMLVQTKGKANPL